MRKPSMKVSEFNGNKGKPINRIGNLTHRLNVEGRKPKRKNLKL